MEIETVYICFEIPVWIESMDDVGFRFDEQELREKKRGNASDRNVSKEWEVASGIKKTLSEVPNKKKNFFQNMNMQWVEKRKFVCLHFLVLLMMHVESTPTTTNTLKIHTYKKSIQNWSSEMAPCNNWMLKTKVLWSSGWKLKTNTTCKRCCNKGT